MLLAKESKRLLSIDILRGWVMVLMALDHCREILFVHASADPLDLSTTSASLFLTRWVTHLCAPSFVFLSGASAYLSTVKTGSANGNFLISRGLWLILLEVTVVNFGIWFDIHFQVILLQVIAAIGAGLMLIGVIIKLHIKPVYTLLAGILIIALSPLLAVNNPEATPSAIKYFFQPGLVQLWGDHMLLVGYPPVPWLGIILVGYGSGFLFRRSQDIRKKYFLLTGFLLLLVFIFLRATSLYGDTSPWVTNYSPFYNFLSFINVSKYPPSLQFSLLMLGIMFLLLYVIERTTRQLSFLSVYGTVPLFYYLIHWYIIHPLLFVILLIQGFRIDEFSFGFNMGRPAEQVSGLPLWGVYLVWITVVIILFPVCKWYGRYKQKWLSQKRWLRYI